MENLYSEWYPKAGPYLRALDGREGSRLNLEEFFHGSRLGLFCRFPIYR